MWCKLEVSDKHYILQTVQTDLVQLNSIGDVILGVAVKYQILQTVHIDFFQFNSVCFWRQLTV